MLVENLSPLHAADVPLAAVLPAALHPAWELGICGEEGAETLLVVLSTGARGSRHGLWRNLVKYYEMIVFFHEVDQAWGIESLLSPV